MIKTCYALYLNVFVCFECYPKLSQDEATTFYDELNHHIFELVSSSDVDEKKGGILAIGKSSQTHTQRLFFLSPPSVFNHDLNQNPPIVISSQ